MAMQTQAYVRLAFGLAQMSGAVFSGILLLATGMSRTALISSLVTTFLTVLSLILFRGRRVAR